MLPSRGISLKTLPVTVLAAYDLGRSVPPEIRIAINTGCLITSECFIKYELCAQITGWGHIRGDATKLILI